MYIKKGNDNSIKQMEDIQSTNLQTTNQDIDEEKMLEQFYEERQSFFEESLNNKSIRTNQSNKNKQKPLLNKPLNFDSFSNHKNVEPKNVITYDSYKNKIDEPLSTIVTPKTNQKTLPNQTKSNQIQFNSFRSKTNNNKKIIQKKSEAKKIPLKSNAKVIENKKNDKEVVSLFPRKLSTSFKPTLLITPTQTDNNTSIVSSNLSRVQNTSVLTEKYQNDIQTIYEKRKNYFDSKSQRNDRRYSSTEIYERSKQYREKTKEKNKKLKESLEKKELNECSFRPKITDKSSRILNDSISYREYNSTEDFYKKNLEWKAKKDQTVQERLNTIERQKYEECSFQPNANNHSRHKEIINELKGKKKDYIYRKNIEWLNKVNENKKRSELEQLEEYNLEIQKAKEQNSRLISYANKDGSIMSHEDHLEKLATPKYVNSKIKRSYSMTSRRSAKKSKEYSTQSKMNHNDIDEIKSLLGSLKDTLEINKNMKESLFNE